MPARVRAAAVVGLVLVLLGLGAGPAVAEPGSPIVVSNVGTAPGKLSLVLTGSGLPEQAALAGGALTVSVEGTQLPVEVTSAASLDPAELPIRSVVLVVETGESTAGAPLVAMEIAVFNYLDRLPADVAAGLVTVSDQARVVAAPTHERTAVRTGAGSLSAGGASALYDAVLLAAGQFDVTSTERRVVLLADGPDQGSQATAGTVATALRDQRVVLDVISYSQQSPGAAVTDLATGSAGVATQAETRADLDRAVRDAAARVPTPIAVTATVPPSLSGQDAAVTIGVSGGGQDLTTTTPVSFAVDPNAVPALETVRLRVLPMVVLYAAMGLVGLAIMIVGFIVVVLLLGRSSARERMRQLERIGGRPTVSIEKQQQADASVVMRTALAVSERAVQRQGSTAIGAALDRAGIALRPAEWMLARAAVAVAGAVVAALIIPWFLGVPFGGLLGWFATSWYRKHRTTKRSQRFGDLLPEALQLVVGALRSGFSLMQAIDAVVREGPEPVSGEFGRAMAEIRLGGEIEAALERTAERNGSRDLAWLVMAIRIQREVGGNLSEVLETAVETMRERGRLVRHVRALSAEGRLSAYVLVGMPLVLSAWMMVFRGEYIKPLVTEPLGFVMLGAGVVMITVGAFWISRLIKVEV